MREAQDLSQILLRDTRYRVHICVSAHPLTNKDNARELNPFLTGVGIHGFVSESTLFNGEVGMGEEIHGSVDFDIAENKKHFFFLRMKSFVKTGRSSPPPLTDMFFPISLYTPHVFSPPTVSSLSSLENFFLGSFAKGPGESAVLERLCRAGIDSQLIPDPHRVWSITNSFRVFLSSPRTLSINFFALWETKFPLISLGKGSWNPHLRSPHVPPTTISGSSGWPLSMALGILRTEPDLLLCFSPSDSSTRSFL